MPPEPGFYYRDGLRAWVRVADPREAPDGVWVWRHDELTVEGGMVRVRGEVLE